MPSTDRPRRRTTKARTAELLREVIDQAEALAVGDDWLRLLKYAEHFHQYGGTNALLILRNRPHATRLATYEQWKHDGHPVHRGEHGITILDPADPSETVRVFDVTQTGQPPTIGPLTHIRPAGDTSTSLLAALTSNAMRKGYDIIRARAQTSARTSATDHTIYIHAVLTDEAACYALAHELAHIQLDNIPENTCHGAHLVSAESVAYLIARRAGLDTTPFTFPDPPTWAGNDPRTNRGQIILDAIEHITTAANATMNQLEAVARGRTPLAQPLPEQTASTRPTNKALPTQPDLPDGAHPSIEVEPASPARQRLIAIHEHAEHFFIDQLPGSWVPGYLAARGLAAALDDDAPWNIGFAPATWTALVDHLHAAHYTDEEIIASGLGKRSKTGNLIDRFRDRMMIPVRTPDGTTIAFIGRANPDQPESPDYPVPKYLNSPQTDLYTKATTLFGLNTARPYLANGALPVLVEGTLDAIAIHIADPDHQYAAVAPQRHRPHPRPDRSLGSCR